VVDAETITPQGRTATATLQCLLTATMKSLSPMAGPKQVLYRFDDAEEAQAQVPSAPVGGDDPGLYMAVKALVQPGPPNQQRYFIPGVSTQVVNCIAVCFPVWLMYGTNSKDDIEARKGLIEDALFFRLIWGTNKQTRAELRDKLQDLYYRLKNGGQV
jgi:hypothetical protein